MFLDSFILLQPENSNRYSDHLKNTLLKSFVPHRANWPSSRKKPYYYFRYLSSVYAFVTTLLLYTQLKMKKHLCDSNQIALLPVQRR